MELYRSLSYDVGLHIGEISSSSTDTTHTSDADWISQAQVSVAARRSIAARRSARTSPGRTATLYRIDTYVHTTTPTSGRAVKQVTVAVRRQEIAVAREADRNIRPAHGLRLQLLDRSL